MTPSFATASASLDGLMWVLVGFFVGLFLVVQGLVAFVAFRRGSTKSRAFDAVWMMTPALLLLGLVGWSHRVLGSDARLAAGEPEVIVHVTGRAFAWKVQYEIPGETGLVDAGWNHVHLPEGKTAKIVLTSEDIVHGFWVPQFRLKADAKPGVAESVVVRPMELGEFNIVCATLCGDQHYAMRGFVHVEPVAVFDAWLAKEREDSAAAPATAAAARAGDAS